MSRIKVLLSTLIIGLTTTAVNAADMPSGSPVGYWKTMDEVTGNPKAIVQIWKSDSGMLIGKIVKVFVLNGTQPTICTACRGENHNQPIVGMIMLSGLKTNSNVSQWNGGSILDHENGKVYNCNLRLTENGKKLNVHNYFGIPLLGHSQTWERVDLMSDKA